MSNMIDLVLEGSDPIFRIKIFTEYNRVEIIFEYSKTPDIT